MFGTQWEFEFDEMKKAGYVVKLPRKPLPVAERDRLIVDLRRRGFFYEQIKEQARCSDGTIAAVLRRDAPDLLTSNRLKGPPKKDLRSEAQLLALPPTDGEPVEKLGVHFWDMPTFGRCKYIVAKDPDDNLARYCGEGAVTFGCSWCEKHLAVVAQPRRKFMTEAA